MVNAPNIKSRIGSPSERSNEEMKKFWDVYLFIYLLRLAADAIT
jgi:hypothetical protein